MKVYVCFLKLKSHRLQPWTNQQQCKLLPVCILGYPCLFYIYQTHTHAHAHPDTHTPSTYSLTNSPLCFQSNYWSSIAGRAWTSTGATLSCAPPRWRTRQWCSEVSGCFYLIIFPRDIRIRAVILSVIVWLCNCDAICLMLIVCVQQRLAGFSILPWGWCRSTAKTLREF